MDRGWQRTELIFTEGNEGNEERAGEIEEDLANRLSLSLTPRFSGGSAHNNLRRTASAVSSLKFQI
jgi:hypothetical protein